MTTTDSLTRLATIRPDEDTLAHDWSPARRANVLARVHAATSDAPAAATVTPLTRRRLFPAAASSQPACCWLLASGAPAS